MRTGDESSRESVILRARFLPLLERGSGVTTVPLATRKRGSESFLSGITSFEPGSGLPLHTHNCVESVVILEGTALVQIGVAEAELEPDDATIVPAGTPHRFLNASNSQRMRILWVYGSVDADRTIVDTGQTTRIDAEHTGLRSRPVRPERS